jgi:hypothetical protein
MATSKSKIAEQVVRQIGKYTDESNIDEREVMLAIHQSLGSLVRLRFFESKNTEAQEVDGSLYYSVDDISVLKKGKKYYIKMPSTSISLPFGVEIKRVGTEEGRGYVPTQNGFNDLHTGLASSCLEGSIGYYKQGNNLFFVNMNSTNNPETVDLVLALPFESLDEDDEINIPSDMLDEVIERVVMKFVRTEQMPTDDTNNSID